MKSRYQSFYRNNVEYDVQMKNTARAARNAHATAEDSEEAGRCRCSKGAGRVERRSLKGGGEREEQEAEKEKKQHAHQQGKTDRYRITVKRHKTEFGLKDRLIA